MANLYQKMNAAFHVGKHRIAIRETPIPKISEDEYLIKTKACAICGSDLRWWSREATNEIHGHESIGIVVDAGRNATAFQEGDRVIPYVIRGCGRCAFCSRGFYIYCKQNTGITTGFAEYQAVPERYLMDVPGCFNDEEATLLGDNLGTPLRALRKASVEEGETAVVFGLGPLGLIAIQGLLFFGAENVIGIDVQKNRCDIATELGATLTLDASTVDFHRQVFRITKGIGAHVVINTVDAADAAAAAFNLLRPGGRLILIAGNCTGYGGQGELRGRAERQIIGTFYFPRTDYEENIRIVRSGLINLKRLVSHVYPFEEINEAFEMRFKNPDKCLKVVIGL